MDTAAIRTAIVAARRQEADSPSLRHFFAERMHMLTKRLVIPADRPLNALEKFVGQYIDFVPVFLDQVAESRPQPHVQRYLNMAEDFFLAPPDILAEEGGLKALLDEAFLAQRLLEELNDQQLRCGRKPVLRLDMTRANIIVHYLLGDPLAPRLEALVNQCVRWLTDRPNRFGCLAQAETTGNSHWRELPCMSRSTGIDLRLPGQSSFFSREPEGG